ncbi:MAG: hypothetical protein GX333_05145 [Syntrophomonadaceae bacterium]|nr:hypothetical protein [Syntrophomonadaceae bacterium]
MINATREDNIRRIISMEDRALKCYRCPELQRCVRKPNLGKGDLEPEAVFVFESANNFNEDIDNLLQLRKNISTAYGINKIYHTFLVRCQPKACPAITNLSCYGEDAKLIDKDYKCILTNSLCDGVPIRPTDTQIVSCLSYTIEEIAILNPNYIFLFGERVGDFLLKSWGVFADKEVPYILQYEDNNIFVVDYEEKFDESYCNEVKALLKS